MTKPLPSSPAEATNDDVIFLLPGAGRAYDVGPMRSVFKADGAETAGEYCVSEWFLEPGQSGPGPHSHGANVELFYVVEGTMSFLAGAEWINAPRGSFVRIPAGTLHDFENRGDSRSGVLNVFIPGGFEASMPRLVAWTADVMRGDPPAS